MDQATIERYSRQLNLPDFSLEQQEKLAQARVLVVGAGGLGSPLLLYLAAAGIGSIGIVEFDKVEIHNLHRQILYSTKDIGKFKVDVALERIKAINPSIQSTIFNERLSTKNVERIFNEYDIIADGTDNFPTRYLINDACVKFEKTNVFASVHRYEGQVAIFNFQKEDGSFSSNYRDLFPTPPTENAIPNCAEAGVLGPVVGMIACIQAQEIIKIASGMTSQLVDKVLSIDLQDYQMRSFKLKTREDHPYRNETKDKIILEDYDELCKIPIESNLELDSYQIIDKLNSTDNIKVIDIREPEEFNTYHIGAENIPQKALLASSQTLSDSCTYILHCQSGKRSRAVLDSIIQNNGSSNIYHLKGGINQWIEEQGKEAKLPI